jgi:hypothetical protein
MRQPGTDKRFGAWGALAGAVGGLCCVGPSAAVLLGLGSSSALAGLALDRTFALASGVGLLAIGMAIALRRSRACDLRNTARWRVPVVMLVTAMLSYALLGQLLPGAAASQVEAEANQAPPESQMVVAASAGAKAPALRRAWRALHFGHNQRRAAHVRSLLRRKPFVRGFFAEEGIDSVTIDYDSSQISPADLATLIPLRYGVEVISDVAYP